MCIRDRAWRGALCENADLDFWISSFPMELAFALAFLASKVPVDAIPAWVQKKMPGVQRVLNALCHAACEKGCDYCQSRLNLHAGLKAWFGFDGFRIDKANVISDAQWNSMMRHLNEFPAHSPSMWHTWVGLSGADEVS